MKKTLLVGCVSFAVATSIAHNLEGAVSAQLSDYELHEIRGAAVVALGSEFGECGGTLSCTDANATPGCGVRVSGVCVPSTSLCAEATPCQSPATVVLTCVGLLGICDIDPSGAIECPDPNGSENNWGQCVNLIGGPACDCVDTGFPSGIKCTAIAGEC